MSSPNNIKDGFVSYSAGKLVKIPLRKGARIVDELPPGTFAYKVEQAAGGKIRVICKMLPPVAGQEVASQEVASQEVASQEVASQEVASQEVASQEVASQEVATTNGDDAQIASEAQGIESHMTVFLSVVSADNGYELVGPAFKAALKGKYTIKPHNRVVSYITSTVTSQGVDYKIHYLPKREWENPSHPTLIRKAHAKNLSVTWTDINTYATKTEEITPEVPIWWKPIWAIDVTFQ